MTERQQSVAGGGEWFVASDVAVPLNELKPRERIDRVRCGIDDNQPPVHEPDRDPALRCIHDDDIGQLPWDFELALDFVEHSLLPKESDTWAAALTPVAGVGSAPIGRAGCCLSPMG